MSGPEDVDLPDGFDVTAGDPVHGHVTVAVEYVVADEDVVKGGGTLLDAVRGRLWAAGVLSRAVWNAWSDQLHPGAVEHRCWHTAGPAGEEADTCHVWAATSTALPRRVLDVDEAVAAFLVVPAAEATHYVEAVRGSLAAVLRIDREVLAWAARGGEDPVTATAS